MSGRPLAHWGFYMALGYFKLAVIAAGIDFRMRMADEAEPEGHPGGGSDRIGAAVAPLIMSGLAALR
jgi:aminoglycoside phosphotransferase (APT) family kinase protein